ncbi:dynein regulatory complex subunit 7 [Nilaparvata lugens]|uniref:dynein regulatory complex subunit 7 n=1 Tax=Nilaparvata lugens TaxID=108931 RepID=UPI00193D70E2|nr:dynein regulatory complex subunit 7 [Nilaparvata lugens]
MDSLTALKDLSYEKISSNIEYNEQDSNISVDQSYLEDKSGESKDLEIGQDDLDKLLKLVTESHLKSMAHELGIIRLCWPSVFEDCAESLKVFPHSYKTNTAKEKLILFYAENFRRQFCHLHSSRKPLLLAIDNECGIQASILIYYKPHIYTKYSLHQNSPSKFVSTTIRPTKITYPEFYTWQGCASFVADHITYIPMPKEKPTTLSGFVLNTNAELPITEDVYN